MTEAKKRDHHRHGATTHQRKLTRQNKRYADRMLGKAQDRAEAKKDFETAKQALMAERFKRGTLKAPDMKISKALINESLRSLGIGRHRGGRPGSKNLNLVYHLYLAKVEKKRKTRRQMARQSRRLNRAA